ncbi:MAG: hypothetical protein V1859_02370 [archaeon]
MITIDAALKKIYFQNEYHIGKEPMKTHECELVAAYMCPKCEQIILAYFKTDVFIPIWKYDEKEKDKNYDSESERRYYKYRVFYAGCGVMGIELKEHNSYNGCSFKINQSYNLISSVNSILKYIEKELTETLEKKKKVCVKPLPNDFSKTRLIQNLRETKEITLISDVCGTMDPLIRIEPVKHDEIDIYQYERDSEERKKAELHNYESMKKAYADLIKSVKK